MASALEVIREAATLIKDPAGTPLYFHFKDGCTLKPVQNRFAVAYNGRMLDNRIQSQMFEISGRLVGEWENLSVLFPHVAADLGSRLIGATDVDWKLITESGREWTFHRAAITKRPGLMSKVGDTLLGEITLTACYSTTQSAWYSYQTGQTHPGFASLSNAAVLTLAPSIAFGSDPWDELWPVDGIEFDFAWDLEPVLYNNQILDWTIKGQTPTAKIKPQTDATFGEWMTKIGADLAMGSASIPVANLVASYSGFYAALYNAQLTLDGFTFKNDANWVDGIVATAMQRHTAGVADNLFYVGTAAPA